jgi:uncharacterized protein YndB with AHSA1/START domain
MRNPAPATRKNAADASSRATKAPELTITRTFDAPRELVWKLFTEPEHLLNWMGPRGFTPMHFTQDPRVGGRWRGMLRPDKGSELGTKDLWQGGVFREIEPPERVSYTFAWEEDDNGKPGNEMLVTLSFEERGGKTKLTFHQTGFTSEGQRDGHDGGWNSAFDKLEDYIAAQSAQPAK